eukprot:TRINITY_DN6443_c2_g1_i3.p1 TRINITY_DN6443_c2_g1~~TRINITY_DN6443_c2_g1_i3.p1  ORF type:complete len:146 (+),score=15.66 TRINITY_DN6443_c2_g1_i3:29-439(+)
MQENQLVSKYDLENSNYEIEEIRHTTHRGLQIQSPQLIQVQIKRQLTLPQWVLDPLKDTWKLIRQINSTVLPESSAATKMIYKEHSLKTPEHVCLPPDITRVLQQKAAQAEEEEPKYFYRWIMVGIHKIIPFWELF